ncbi:MAG: NAD(P)H-dependent oxidoreductase subunit E [Thermodesulfobacteriota bacterium]
MDLQAVCEIIERHGYQKASLIGILQDIQSRMNYLPRKALIQVSKSLDIPLTTLYEVATFYKAFTLEPKGRHTIQVCLGTACHVRGGARILNYLENRLGIKCGGTTKDLTFSLESVNCLGACALGPILVMDKKYYGKINTNKIDPILKKYQNSKLSDSVESSI